MGGVEGPLISCGFLSGAEAAKRQSLSANHSNSANSKAPIRVIRVICGLSLSTCAYQLRTRTHRILEILRLRPWSSPRHHRPLAKPRVPAPLRMTKRGPALALGAMRNLTVLGRLRVHEPIHGRSHWRIFPPPHANTPITGFPSAAATGRPPADRSSVCGLMPSAW
jgi:hypothetical protein